MTYFDDRYFDVEYAKGFTEGECIGFHDRQLGRVQVRPGQHLIKTARAFGFWDGYSPRSATWANGRVPTSIEALLQ